MLVKAMEVSGIEGNFRSTCENVMQVLRTNKDSVMAMMEAFVHDPLINWRLFNFNEVPQLALLGNNNPNAPADVEPEEEDEDPADIDLPQPQRSTREKEILQVSFEDLYVFYFLKGDFSLKFDSWIISGCEYAWRC